MIIEQMQVTIMAVFCYLVCDEKTREAALIDPAGDYDLIMGKVKEHGAQVRYVINTHGHWDHTSGNDHIIKKTGAGLLIHSADAKSLSGIAGKILSRFLGGKGSPAPVRTLEDGDEIALGNTSLKVIHTPGHSEGSICIYGEGNLFTGDTLFTEGTGRTDLPGGSTRKITESIRNRILTLPDSTKIWPGHNYGRFPVSTVKEQKRYYL
jgi:hydroxyacylglutathione hydrolase